MRTKFLLQIFLFALTLVAGSWSPASADEFDDCAQHLPYGVPETPHAGDVVALCHKGYAALVDRKARVPLWVAYRLTRAHSIGCLDRTDDFHAEDMIPEDYRATPSDYDEPKYDQGHMAPAQDFAWSDTTMYDSFSMANMAPQIAGLNRQGWERLEEMVRAWAYQRKEVIVYVGPVLPAHPKTIGPNHVAVPMAFWKVIVDPNTEEAIAFVMPQKKISKANAAKQFTSIWDVEQQSGITLPLPDGTEDGDSNEAWPADLPGWRAKKKSHCGGH